MPKYMTNVYIFTRMSQIAEKIKKEKVGRTSYEKNRLATGIKSSKRGLMLNFTQNGDEYSVNKAYENGEINGKAHGKVKKSYRVLEMIISGKEDEEILEELNSKI